MTLLQAAVLGIVQGVTEWLPVSSTAHLILVPWLLGWEVDAEARVPFDVIVQGGTLVAVVVYFRRDLLAILRAAVEGLLSRAPLATTEARLGWWILLGTVPAAAAALSFQSAIESLHGRPVVVAAVLLGATAILFVGERAGRRDRGLPSLSARGAFGIGCAQAIALVPGVSRSAATIAGGMLAGLDRTSAARFSFLLSVPVMAAAVAKKALDLREAPDPLRHLPALAFGFAAAAVVGYATIHWLLGFLARRPLTVFAWYRIAAAAALLALAYAR